MKTLKDWIDYYSVDPSKILLYSHNIGYDSYQPGVRCELELFMREVRMRNKNVNEKPEQPLYHTHEALQNANKGDLIDLVSSIGLISTSTAGEDIVIGEQIFVDHDNTTWIWEDPNNIEKVKGKQADSITIDEPLECWCGLDRSGIGGYHQSYCPKYTKDRY